MSLGSRLGTAGRPRVPRRRARPPGCGCESKQVFERTSTVKCILEDEGRASRKRGTVTKDYRVKSGKSRPRRHPEPMRREESS
jgi:hypothetical protein